MPLKQEKWKIHFFVYLPWESKTVNLYEGILLGTISQVLKFLANKPGSGNPKLHMEDYVKNCLAVLNQLCKA